MYDMNFNLLLAPYLWIKYKITNYFIREYICRDE